MGNVQLLPEDLINKIAAGEVVDRPSSAVKELVENAIDAGAERIEVEAEQGGRALLRVVDDGSGMSKEDALLAIQRHATSKIKTEDDLFAIRTMGFRGEALPSIAAVSRFLLQTRIADEEAGLQIAIDGGKAPVVTTIGKPVGTTIEVRDLFFNVPARRKFLKSEATEANVISEIMRRYALAYPQKRFRLSHNQRNLFNLPAVSDLRERAIAVLGRAIGEGLYPFSLDEGWLKIHGLFSKPEVTCQQATQSLYFFVNHRYIRNRPLSGSCLEAYRGAIDKGRYPYVLLFLEVDPSEVDINVHPQKIEARFQREVELQGRVLVTLRQALAQTPWAKKPAPPPGTPSQTQAPTLLASPAEPGVLSSQKSPGPPASPERSFSSSAASMASVPSAQMPGLPGMIGASLPTTQQPPRSKDATSPGAPTFSPRDSSQPLAGQTAAPTNFSAFQDRFSQTVNQAQRAETSKGKEIAPPLPPLQEGLGFLPGWDSPLSASSSSAPLTSLSSPLLPSAPSSGHGTQTSSHPDSFPIESAIPAPLPLIPPSPQGFFSSLRYIGQFAQMFLIFESKDHLILLDQHAAHERINYQRLLEAQRQASIPQERFLFPKRLELGLVAAQQAEEYQDELERLGISIEPFGGQSFALKAVPSVLKDADPLHLVMDVLAELALGKKVTVIEDRMDALLMRMACHRSIRGDHRLTTDEVRSLMQQLDEADFRGNCPHGRPIFFEMTRAEIEKRFHRS